MSLVYGLLLVVGVTMVLLLLGYVIPGLVLLACAWACERVLTRRPSP
jgi:hypothetical protein